ncbi:hypothetical protein [Serratia ficaria]|uniref:hypothetical protein n=1 Tax=Serratia ficaria TaxID=61651 RepID=UPI0021826C3E|nr:hypothetical protein [Serratia ficaria]CAI2467902.1 Uncharacterised protein [Serratia ficaria]
MRQQIAIVGGGVTAGLTARLLASSGEITLVEPVRPFVGGIPEIVPRRAFLDALEVSQEDEWVANVAPQNAAWATWRNGAVKHEARLASTSDFLVYDKSRLAKLLIESAPLSRRITRDVAEIGDLMGFDRIFDCRGAKAVRNDPAYQYRQVWPARTACRYVVAASPVGCNDRVMRFWSEIAADGNKHTFFHIPVGVNRVSLGCSCTPDALISTADLFAAAAKACRVPLAEAVLFNGVAVAQPSEMACSLVHVTPLGEAAALSCPLSEYGTLKALSQILDVAGCEPLSATSLHRPLSGEVDPHVPQELFS